MSRYIEGLKVGISVKSLYESKCDIAFGTIVPNYEDGRLAYYDIYNSNGELVCCDGEELIIDQVSEGLVSLRSFNSITNKTVYLLLTKDEADIAIYM